MDFPIFSNSSGMYTLPDQIVNNVVGAQFDCASGDSFQVNQCWNQVKEQMTTRTPRWDSVCSTWHAEMPTRFYAEQGTVRRLLCQGGLNETQLTYCKDLEAAVQGADCQAVVNQADPSAAVAQGVPLCGEEPTPSPNSAASTATTWWWGTTTAWAAAVVVAAVVGALW
eukprot:scaffold2640_cov180-Amphora_coffeaeformis.AAC.10